MQKETASAIALKAIGYIVSEDHLRDRFIALTGLGPEEMRQSLTETEFQASVLEFLMGHDPDLMAFAEVIEENPEDIPTAWRALGGGIGQEW